MAARVAGALWLPRGAQLITTAVQRSGVKVQIDSFVGDEIRVLGPTAFYPVHWRKPTLQQFYEKRISETAWANLRNKNTAVHFWNKLSTNYSPAPDSLAQRVMRSNCGVCDVNALRASIQRARAGGQAPAAESGEESVADTAAGANAAVGAASALAGAAGPLGHLDSALGAGAGGPAAFRRNLFGHLGGNAQPPVGDAQVSYGNAQIVDGNSQPLAENAADGPAAPDGFRLTADNFR